MADALVHIFLVVDRGIKQDFSLSQFTLPFKSIFLSGLIFITYVGRQINSIIHTEETENIFSGI